MDAMFPLVHKMKFQENKHNSKLNMFDIVVYHSRNKKS